MPVMLALGVIAGIFIEKYASTRTISPEQEKLQTILGLIKDQYVDRVNVDSLMETMLPDLMTSLDPHSDYLPKTDFTASTEELEGSFGGVGVSFQVLSDTVKVLEVVAGGPAEMVGVQPGDMILEANGKKLSGASITTDDVFKTLRGKEGTKVKLTVKRRGSKKPLTFEVIRDQIPQFSVDTKYKITNEIGYMRVNKFTRNTYKEFMDGLMELSKQGAKKFVIDLRGNAGGYMDQPILMANEFLPKGRTIVYSKGRRPENEIMAASDGSGQFQNSEIVVLTNEFSASSSEIFAGAIQDNDRGLVVGRRTFGKGLVQNPIMLPDSSQLRLTVARYYTPSGRSIQKEYQRGRDGKYSYDILDRYSHGEFFSQDSIKFDKNKIFKTVNGRTVYGGGGIMPDIFVPEDTTGYTSYYAEAVNKGIIQRFADDFAERYRPMMNGKRNIETLMRIMPRDNTLLTSFANYASQNGLPARWYYINRSRDILLNQIKGVIARNLIGYDAFIQVLNQNDKVVQEAVNSLESGKSPVSIRKSVVKKK